MTFCRSTPSLLQAFFSSIPIGPNLTGCGTCYFNLEYFNSEYEFMLPLQLVKTAPKVRGCGTLNELSKSCLQFLRILCPTLLDRSITYMR
jgi:hypothetical protein